MAFIPRTSFPYPLRTPSWFAGHMSRSLRELPTLLEDIDLVIEARDARLPLTSINKTFDEMLNRVRNRKGGKGKGKEREKIVVYTKRDLAERRYEEPLAKAFLEHAGQRVMFADTRSDRDVREVLKYAVRIAKDNAETIPDLRVLVVGMPNVGKSSLLNALRRVGVRKGKAFRTGAEAGITKKLTGTVRIHEDPSVYVYDTPGVMMPYLGRGEEGAERGLKLALTAGIKESLFEQDATADYLLWKMNRRLVAERNLPEGHPDKLPPYLSFLPLPKTFEPTDHLPTLLDGLCDRLGALKKGGERDYEAGQGWLIRAFREGKLGGWTLDDLALTPLGRGKGHGGVSGGVKLNVGEEAVSSGTMVSPGATSTLTSTTPQTVLSSSSTPTAGEGEAEHDIPQDTTSTIATASSSSPPSAQPPSSASAPSQIQTQQSQSQSLDAQVSRTVLKYLQSLSPSSTSPSSSSPTTGASLGLGSASDGDIISSSLMSGNQQRKALKRQKLEERDSKLRKKGINVPLRQWGEGNSLRGKSATGSKSGGRGGLGKGSVRGEAGRIMRSRR